MAACLHKLLNRASVIGPILNPSRSLTTASFIGLIQINSTIVPQKLRPVAKTTLLNSRIPTFTQNVAPLSQTTLKFNKEADPNDGGANEEKLSKVFESLRDTLPQFFVQPIDYNTIHKDIVFENRIHGKTHHGIVAYMKQLHLLRFVGHFIYAYVKLDVIKITKHTEDSSIKVRWRITGITGYRILFKMLKFRVWRPQQMIEQHQTTWLDGFSTFYVNEDGFIVRHIADKVMPDEDKELNPIEKAVDKLGQIPKLALVVKISADIAPAIV